MKYCPKCNLVVAPGDPERVVLDVETWHKDCLQKHLRTQTGLQVNVEAPSPQQLTLWIQ